MVNGTKRGPKQLGEIILDTANVNGISTEFLEKSIQRLINILGTPSATYKDRIFRMLVKEKKIALEIYNAINDTHYDNPEDVIITPLENAVYLGMKNDVSFIIGSELVLFEQQSTNNPNMPLRNLFYVTCMLAALTMNTNIYGSKLIRIPEPKFIVFYNGLEELPEQFNMSLSDAYEKKSQDISLELKVKVLNVNRGYNDSLMKKSPTLYQYMMFVDTVRRFQKEYPFEQAMEQAIDECIRTGILSDFLRKSRAEVMRMWLFEYDQEKHIEMEKEESYEDGKREYLITLVVKLKNKGKTVDEIADILEEPVEKIQKICEISENYAPDYDAQKIYQELENSEY